MDIDTASHARTPRRRALPGIALVVTGAAAGAILAGTLTAGAATPSPSSPTTPPGYSAGTPDGGAHHRDCPGHGSGTAPAPGNPQGTTGTTSEAPAANT